MSFLSSSSIKKSASSRGNSPVPTTTSSSTPLSAMPMPSAGAKDLQEQLHLLLNRLSKTTELVKTWPESDGDDASVHVETTTKLISSIVQLVSALQRVEGVIKTNANLKKTLQECQVPVNLLDLLDHHPDGLNPDCFSRGLLREALGQLGGLKRRKLALEMLGAAVQKGLDSRNEDSRNSEVPNMPQISDALLSNKRNMEVRDSKNLGGEGTEEDGSNGSTLEPLTKKARTSAEA
jgi:hypothetical protein